MRFEPNDDGINRAGIAAVTELNRRIQPDLDRIHAEMAGRPVEEIKPKIKAAWRAKAGGDLPPAELTRFATAISQGQRVVLRVGAVKR